MLRSTVSTNRRHALATCPQSTAGAGTVNFKIFFAGQLSTVAKGDVGAVIHGMPYPRQWALSFFYRRAGAVAASRSCKPSFGYEWLFLQGNTAVYIISRVKKSFNLLLPRPSQKTLPFVHTYQLLYKYFTLFYAPINAGVPAKSGRGRRRRQRGGYQGFN